MNIVNSGNKYMVYGEDVKTYKVLPPNAYTVNFSQMTGYSLSLHHDLSVNEKVYGPYITKVDKVLKTFSAFDRNMGIILSGPKGVGKSMFARQLALKGKELNLPLILVENNTPGIADFISSIQQECIVLFDEFEKNFRDNEGNNSQEKLLSLFDGIDNGKKLFVITCNRTRELNEYLLNRPGRFHYHFVLTTPTREEIREYMNDILVDEAKQYIDKLVNACASYRFTYDILRAIAFELNNGYDLTETLNDLNIAKEKSFMANVEVTFMNGMTANTSNAICIDYNYDRYMDPYVRIDEDSLNKMPDNISKWFNGCHVTFCVDNIECDEFGYYVDGEYAEVNIQNAIYSAKSNGSGNDIANELEKYLDELEIDKVRLIPYNDQFTSKFNW